MEKYNGWTNYETWLCKLWMDNDGDEYYREMSQEAFGDAESSETFTKAEQAALDLADSLKGYWEAILEEQIQSQSGFIADLINAGVSSVNWDEIAKGLIEECEESETA